MTPTPSSWARRVTRASVLGLVALLSLVALLLIGPLTVMASGAVDLSNPWYAAKQDRTGLAPDPAAERGAAPSPSTPGSRSSPKGLRPTPRTR